MDITDTKGLSYRFGGSEIPRVFTVNPNPASASVTTRTLGSVNIGCQVFASPLEMINHPPVMAGCFLFDFTLPDISGMQLMERLRRMNCFQPVIFTATRVDTDAITAASNRGAFGFLKKPFDSLELIDMVQRALMLNQTVSPYVNIALDYRERTQQLTRREQEILHLLEIGRTAREIGSDFNLSNRTVENHRARIFSKLNINQAYQLIQRVTILNVLRAQGTID